VAIQKVPYRGYTIDAVEVEVITSNEPWNEYQLGNGKVLMIKTVLISVLRALSEKNADGSDLYLTQTTNHVRVK